MWVTASATGRCYALGAVQMELSEAEKIRKEKQARCKASVEKPPQSAKTQYSKTQYSEYCVLNMTYFSSFPGTPKQSWWRVLYAVSS
mmetsp:Transcript_10867/g.28528  ORF Transcript_10867/g.28528 Transcript_10867/m.28528 type:complete len:87 (-) Transcript_10867:2425-2685(-)